MSEGEMLDPTEWMEEVEGQLAIDVYHTADHIVIKAPIAGVRQEDLEVSITDEQVTIKGERRDYQNEPNEGYLVQECYWGAFSRTYDLPIQVDSDQAQARLIDGILTISIPKAARIKARTISVQIG
jgi:HSP20 family protein